MEIERTCVQAHPDRPWSRRPRIGLLYSFYSIQTARCFDDDGFHNDLQFERVATNGRFYYLCRKIASLGFSGQQLLAGESPSLLAH